MIAASALAKYFGATLILLLAVYSFARLRRFGNWIWYLLIPVAALLGYEWWMRALYGQGLIASAAEFASTQRALGQASLISMVLVGLSFTGGCALTVLALCPLAWSWRATGLVAASSVLAACALTFGWFDFGMRVHGEQAIHAFRAQGWLLGSQLALFIAGGIFTLLLAIVDYWNKRDPDSLLLGSGSWYIVFASFLNWTVNARSVLPLIPAAGILTVRRLETTHHGWTRFLKLRVAAALVFSGVVSIWLGAAEAHSANVAREAAHEILAHTNGEAGTLWHEGQWGFQYYMEQLGARPVVEKDSQIRPGDFVAVAEQSIGVAGLPRNLSFRRVALLEFPNRFCKTLSWQRGAGFTRPTGAPCHCVWPCAP